MTETILVTGGTGHIGSHCCQRLAAAGFRPVVYDNLSTGHQDFARWGPLIEVDNLGWGALGASMSRPASGQAQT